MSEVALFKLAHLLCLIYWLGGDLGVFYSSLFVTDEKRSPEVRIATAKILLTLDLAPRICMTMILPTGVQLGYNIGMLKIPGLLVAAVWVVCLAWLSMVLVLAFRHGAKLKVLTRVDFHFRWIAPTLFVAYAIHSLLSPTRILPGYIAYKLIIFSCLVLCGLMIRLKLRQFTPAFNNMVQGRHTASDSRAIHDALVSTRPFVLAIWLGILVNVALSINLF